jgi:hypothetical protein
MHHNGAMILCVGAGFGDGGNRRFSVDPMIMPTDSWIYSLKCDPNDKIIRKNMCLPRHAGMAAA